MKNIKQLIIADTLLKTNVDVDAFRSWEKSSLLTLVALLGTGSNLIFSNWWNAILR